MKHLYFLPLLLAFTLLLCSCAPMTTADFEDNAVFGLASHEAVFDLLWTTAPQAAQAQIARAKDGIDYTVSQSQTDGMTLTVLAQAYDGHFGFVFFRIDTPEGIAALPESKNISIGLVPTYRAGRWRSYTLADAYDPESELEYRKNNQKPGPLAATFSWAEAEPEHPNTAYLLLRYALYGTPDRLTLCAATVPDGYEHAAEPSLFRPAKNCAQIDLTQTVTPRTGEWATTHWAGDVPYNYRAVAALSPLGLYLESTKATMHSGARDVLYFAMVDSDGQYWYLHDPDDGMDAFWASEPSLPMTQAATFYPVGSFDACALLLNDLPDFLLNGETAITAVYMALEDALLTLE